MKHKILWIEDDYHEIQGLVRPLEKAGFGVVNAASAIDGYEMAQRWNEFDIILVDLIIPLRRGIESLPAEVEAWEGEAHPGIGLVKWLVNELKVGIPVLMLSIVNDPIANYELSELPGLGYLSKHGRKPSEVKEKVFQLLNLEEQNV